MALSNKNQDIPYNQIQKDHTETGKFAKGNRAGAGRTTFEQSRELKAATRAEVLRCGASLCQPWRTMEEENKSPDCSRLQLLTNRAVMKGDYHFVAFLIEQILGKAKQQDNSESDVKFYIQYDPNKLGGEINGGKQVEQDE